MKPSHLAALALAAISGGLVGGAHAAPETAMAAKANQQHQISASMMVSLMNHDNLLIDFHRPGRLCNWRKLNQRQIRKNRRRAHARGSRKAFA